MGTALARLFCALGQKNGGMVTMPAHATTQVSGLAEAPAAITAASTSGAVGGLPLWQSMMDAAKRELEQLRI